MLLLEQGGLADLVGTPPKSIAIVSDAWHPQMNGVVRTLTTTCDILRQSGHRVEVISGREEARLIFLGVSHTLADDEGKRLVVDIGGGSSATVQATCVSSFLFVISLPLGSSLSLCTRL